MKPSRLILINGNVLLCFNRKTASLYLRCKARKMQFESQQFTKQTNVNNFLSTVLKTTYGMDCLYAVDKCQTM